MMEREATGDDAVKHLPLAHRYELCIDDKRVALADYVERGETWAIVHTEVIAEMRNQGLAARLVRAALDDMRTRGVKVAPACPYVKTFIRRHEEYADLVD